MKFLVKTVLTSSLLLCFQVASAGSRNFILEFATLNPADTNEMDTRSQISTGFSASGNVLINDDIGEAVRTLQICDQAGCVKNSETFTVASYSEGTSAVFLKEKNDGSSEKMTFIWNYQNLGFIEKLSSKWGRFTDQQLAISWKAAPNTGGDTGGGTSCQPHQEEVMRMVYHRYDKYDNYNATMHIYEKGKGVRELKFPGVQTPMNAAFSPDGKEIVFMGMDAASQEGYYKWEIYLYNFETQQITRLTNNDIPDEDPKFSPNGKYITFKREGDIAVMNKDNPANITKITDDKDKVDESMPYFINDKDIVYSREGSRNTEGEIWIYEGGDNNFKGGTNHLLVDTAGDDYYPIYHNGIVYFSSSVTGHGDDMYAYHLDTKQYEKFLAIDNIDESDAAPFGDGYMIYSTNLGKPDRDRDYDLRFIYKGIVQPLPAEINHPTLNELGADVDYRIIDITCK